MKPAELSDSCVLNCHGKSEFKPLIPAILVTDGQLGAKYASFETPFAIH